MTGSTAARSTRLNLPVIVLGVLGLLVSWASFVDVLVLDGLGFIEFWRSALVTGETAGLTWDLVASALICTALAVQRRASLGPRRLALVLAATWVLGVCVGLVVLFAHRPAED